jgi:hypothetical protein
MTIATRHRGEKKPLYVVTNTSDPDTALRVYKWRFWIEPLFGDFKGAIGNGLQLKRRLLGVNAGL